MNISKMTTFRLFIRYLQFGKPFWKQESFLFIPAQAKSNSAYSEILFLTNKRSLQIDKDKTESHQYNKS